MRLLGPGMLSGWLALIGLPSPLPAAPSTTSLSPRRASRPPSGQPSPVWIVHHQLASRIRGMTVENRDGQTFGEVEDFLVDTQLSRVRYVVIAFGGWLGLGRQLRAVPTQLVSTATAKVGIVSLDVGRRLWDRAPTFNPSQLAQLSRKPAVRDAIDRYYAQIEQGLGTSSVHATAARRTAKARPRPVSQRWIPARQGALKLATELLGQAVADPVTKRNYRLSDLLLDLRSQGSSLAILTPSSAEPGTGKLALGLALLKAQAGGLKLAVSAAESAKAPWLDDAMWEKHTTSGAAKVYRYPPADEDPANRALPFKNRLWNHFRYSMISCCTSYGSCITANSNSW